MMSYSSVFKEKLFLGKKVIITGGGTGIGLEIAKLLGRLGAQVLLASRREEKLEAAVDQLRKKEIEANYKRVNIRDEHEVEQLFNYVSETWGSCDFLVNNAGGQFVAPALQISPNGFRSVVDLNLQGTWHMCYYFAHLLKSNNHAGKVVNIVLSQKTGFPTMMHAGAARAGVVNMTKTLAYEWANLNILVNAIAPGTIDTAGLDQYDDEETEHGISRLPIKRMGKAVEIADAVVYLLSPAGNYITGTTLEIDGGEHLLGAAKLK